MTAGRTRISAISHEKIVYRNDRNDVPWDIMYHISSVARYLSASQYILRPVWTHIGKRFLIFLAEINDRKRVWTRAALRKKYNIICDCSRYLGYFRTHSESMIHMFCTTLRSLSYLYVRRIYFVSIFGVFLTLRDLILALMLFLLLACRFDTISNCVLFRFPIIFLFSLLNSS